MTMPMPSHSTRTAKLATAGFIFWLAVINGLYYWQFLDLIVSAVTRRL